MRFNEKELASWATTFQPDKEGLLEKKGATRGQGYRQRWFRLKGNLLFYFRLDEYGGWETGDPLGVIILERCRVDKAQYDTRPYGFLLAFENDDSRKYSLIASSQPELEEWIEAIQAASYEGLRSTLYRLQRELMELTGEDPLIQKGNSAQPVIKSKRILAEKSIKRAMHRHVVNKDRVRRLESSHTLDVPQGRQYELSLKCSKLPVNEKGHPPNTFVRVLVFKKMENKVGDFLRVLSNTEVIESSSEPSYCHLCIMEVGILCPEDSGLLKFEVVSVVGAGGGEEEEEINEALQQASLPEANGKVIGYTRCPVSYLTSSNERREIKLPLRDVEDDNKKHGLLHVTISMKSQSPMLLRKVSVDKKPVKCSHLPTIMSFPSECFFNFPLNGSTQSMRVVEEMAESVFNAQLPIELLKCYIQEDSSQLMSLSSIGNLTKQWKEQLQDYQAILFESTASYRYMLNQLESVADTCGFKCSKDKKDIDLQSVPTNLHIQRMRVHTPTRHEYTYPIITFGCPAYHVGGFKNGGLRRMLNESRSSPSFVCQTESKALAVKSSLAQLEDIEKSFSLQKSLLFSAAANASPGDLNDAMSGISAEVQLLLRQMESSMVRSAIEFLIQARPTPPGFAATPTSSLAMPTSALASPSKRHSVRVSMIFGKCNCGRCCKCIPTPSDWIWNGTKFVQISTGEWKLMDSQESICSSFSLLVEAVEVASQRVVDQQHEAVKAEVGYGFATFKPTYAWSEELIPIAQRLHQTISSLIELAKISLSFYIMELDSHVQGFKSLKTRRDMVFSQALTALVTSFYVTLSHHLTDPYFLQQVREIGFLAQFESLLTSVGDECGMLEDMCIAVQELSTVKFQFAEMWQSNFDGPFDFQLSGTRDSLRIRFLLPRSCFAALMDKHVQQGEAIRVVPILFTQGVNEMQTLANFKSQGHLQEEINLSAMKSLEEYVEGYNKMVPKNRQLGMGQLSQIYSQHKSRNVEFVMAVGQLGRKLKAGRLTCCKSGKDRTGMSVTLEECGMLRNEYQLEEAAFMNALNTLRSHGTRLLNCSKNTGHSYFHFNQFQLMLLPKLLAPPPSTCQVKNNFS